MKLMMTWEVTVDTTRTVGWYFKEVGMTVEMTTKSEEIYLVYPSFVHSLRCYLKRQQDRSGN